MTTEATATATTVDLELDYDRRIQLAMQQNGVPPIRMVRVTHRGAETLRDVVVRVSFDPVVAAPVEVTLGQLAPGATFNLGPEQVAVVLSTERLLNQQERVDGHIRVEARVGEVALGEASLPFELLAYNEWSGAGSPPELLAAFVLPNHPSLSELLGHARTLLGTVTGQTAFDGHQRRDPERVAEVAAAIWGAVGACGITYTTPPASFEVTGQKVRAPEQLMADRAGTCLDLTTLLAAGMEQVGLHPLLVLIDGHAFAGVWLGEFVLPVPAVDDPVVLRKYVDAGEALVFDATMAASGASFREACAAGRRWLDDADRFRFVVDVFRARASGIRPLAMRDASWTPVVAAAAVARTSLSVPTLPRSEDKGATGPAARATRLDRWKTALLDLGGRNRLISFKDTKRSLPLAAHALDVLGTLLVDGQALALQPKLPERETIPVDVAAELEAALDRGQVVTGLTEAEFKKRAVELFRTGQSLLQETGSSPVYLALGFVRWFEGPRSERAHEAPVLLVPVALKRESARDQFTVAWTGDDPMVNVTLLKKFERDFGLVAPGLSEPVLDEQGMDVAAVLQRVRRAILGKERWEVLDKAVIAPFSFQKFLMWQDLEQNTAALLESPVVRHIFEGDGQAFGWESPPLSPVGLDEARPAAVDFSVMDTDSSQLVAVNAALDGNSFVLQGPPGTGKSQTIANLIAQVLARGETVLFVSEKRAALEVVHARLKRVGLGDFCLEAHSEDVSKLGLLNQLQAPFVREGDRPPVAWARKAEELQTARLALNRFVECIHRPGSWGRSVFQATSELIGLKDAPERSMDFPAELGATDVEASRAALADLTAEIVQEGVPGQHRWAAARTVGWSPGYVRQVEAALDGARPPLAALEEAAGPVVAMLRLPWEAPPLTSLALVVDLARALLDAPRPPEALVRETNPAALDELRRLQPLLIEHQGTRQALAVTWRPELLQLDLPAEHRRFTAWARAFFLLAFLFLWSARRRLRQVAVAPLPSNVTVAEDLGRALRVKELEASIASVGPAASRLLAERWRGPETDAEGIAALLTWHERLHGQTRALVGQLGDLEAGAALRERVVELLSQHADDLAADGLLGARLSGLVDAWESWVAANGALEAALWLEPTNWRGQSAPAMGARLEDWRAHTGELRAWSGVLAAVEAARGRGLGVLVDAAWSGELEPSALVPAYDRALRQGWVEREMERYDALRQFRGQAHDRRIEQFRTLDVEMQRYAQQEIQARLAARLPDTGAPGEMAVLRREFGKKRRHKPIRKLFSELPTVITRIKPCVLMSPLSVARFLDPAMAKFDVVVFDEASQIPPWDAIGAIARGRRVMIVGDSKQLPPTSFFQRGEDGDEDLDDEDQVDLESILDECVAAGLPTLQLNWHYRSRHEDLIAFSNFHYYDNRLLTFPSALHDVPHLGVDWIPIPDGFYDRGKSRTNAAEARAVVNAVCERLNDPARAGKSIGIVTFSMAQQRLIEDLLDERRRQNPALEPHFNRAHEPVFVKNLESVQGDERDVMMFSVGYGPDLHGKVSMNFGPLNRQGGERRLNVAITRARELLQVFSTLRADQINLAGTSALGVRHLKTFLDFAARGQAAIAEATHANVLADFESPFEQQVAERLEAEGYEVHRQVGCAGYRIDLAVVDPTAPGSYLLGVECDGASYHSGKTARDRDRIRQSVLEGLGWRIHRIWSTDWWLEPERVFLQACAAIEAAAEAAARAAVPAPVMTVAPATEPAPAAEPPPREVDWAAASQLRIWPAHARPWAAPTVSDGGPREAFDRADSAAVIAAQLVDLAMQAAPMTFDHALALILPTWGFAQSGKRNRVRVHEVATKLAATGRLHLDDEAGLVWLSAEQARGWTAFRNDAAASRTPDQLPTIELANAAAWLVELSGSIDEDELTRELAEVFGFMRLGSRVRARMTEGLQHALRSLQIVFVDGRYRTPDA